jgi:hypothetical protein
MVDCHRLFASMRDKFILEFGRTAQLPLIAGPVHMICLEQR